MSEAEKQVISILIELTTAQQQLHETLICPDKGLQNVRKHLQQAKFSIALAHKMMSSFD